MVTPTPAVTWPDPTSTGSRRVSRLADRITGGGGGAGAGAGAGPAGGGTDPPTRPVLPPCGTIAAPCAAQARITSATSPAEPGLTTQLAMPA